MYTQVLRLPSDALEFLAECTQLECLRLRFGIVEAAPGDDDAYEDERVQHSLLLQRVSDLEPCTRLTVLEVNSLHPCDGCEENDALSLNEVLEDLPAKGSLQEVR